MSWTERATRVFWRRLSVADLVACAVLVAHFVIFFGPPRRLPTIWVSRVLALLAVSYLVIRLIGWRKHWLWSLRNQLIAVYVFLSVLPISLLLVMSGLGLYLLYWHFGAYLVYADLERHIEELGSTADTLTTAYALEIASTGSNAPVGVPPEPPPHTAIFLSAAQGSLPGLKIELGTGQDLLARARDRRHFQFAGLVADQGALALRAVIERRVNGKELIVSAEVPVTPEFVSTLEPGLGPIEIVTTRERKEDRPPPPPSPYHSHGHNLIPLEQVHAAGRTLAPRAHWFDYSVSGFTRVDAVNLADITNADADVPVIVGYTARASQLNARLLALVGEWGGVAVTALLAVGAMFVLIELAALAGSISLTRSITRAVDDLSRATRYVESGDFGHRIEMRHRDQLGDLGQAFNSMTASVSTLIVEQRQRQRLEHELAIARQVQAQLFPKQKPAVQGVEIEAVCRPARVVSGDYYDFLPLGTGRLGIALADISGKGISAALIMASLQAALRSQALFNGHGGTAEIVARLNQHLYRSTAPDRFATLFYGVYDAQTRRLEYTNAGHPAPLCIAGQRVERLSTGGTVLGLFEDRRYESQAIEIAPGSLLLAYSDGLSEAENSKGEEFGDERVLDVALRMGQAPAGVALQNLLKVVDQWTGPSEQLDDLTVIVARF